MGTIYLVNTLRRTSIYSKHIFNVTIILKPFMLIIKFEYICNLDGHIHSKYLFVNFNMHNFIL